jgi:hypothetical protein
MSRTITIPPGARVEARIVSQDGDAEVVILPPGAASVHDVLGRKPALNANVTHDLGTAWPDAFGCQLAQAAIDDGGFVLLQFQSAADAADCVRRLRSGWEA